MTQAPLSTGPTANPARPSFDAAAGRTLLLAGALAIILGMAQAVRFAWVTDDAYISFRYARNLVRGMGLIFNVGERVEGYSNFLWTLWCAAGIRLGLDPELWAKASGVVCFAGTLALLVLFSWRRRSASPLGLPLAALAIAVHRDAAVFATSGLEGSLFTLLLVAAALLLVAPHPSGRRAALAGFILALSALTRPDGAIFVVLGGLFLAWPGRGRGRAIACYAAASLAVLIPFAAWKLSFYGDVFPNTYYAKSAMRSWFGQGWVYVALYFAKYWVLAAAVPLALVAKLSGRASGPSERHGEATAGPDRDPEWLRGTVLFAAFAIAYTIYVARVGGDFMYARLLVPVAPFYAMLLELAIERLRVIHPGVRTVVAVAALVAIAATPSPVANMRWIRKIVDEWQFYQERDRAGERRAAQRLEPFFHGLPLRVTFAGTQALTVYWSDPPVAIETTTGLTDAWVAHQPLARRGRPGHEKKAPFLYLIERRRAHLCLAADRDLADSLQSYIPIVLMDLGDFQATLLTWDPAIVGELVRRGAVVPDFVGAIDTYIARMPTYTDASVRADYVKLRRFYFAVTGDTLREASFLARLTPRR